MARFKPLWLIPFCIIFVLISFSYVVYSPPRPIRDWRICEPLSEPEPTVTAVAEQDFTAGNATLGFQSILVLSQGTQWRVDGVQAAARASGIQVEIPPQPRWSAPFIEAFRNFSGEPGAYGAAMAWLAHIDLLKYVIQSGYTSALIMEDDVDWDVGVRNQTRLIADAVRTLTHHKVKGNDPYSLNWDILWLGHCSDPLEAEMPMVIFKDPTVVPIQEYVGLDTWIKNVLHDGERAVHYSHNPVCSFAYAVSPTGAKKVLELASLGKGGAFDLMLMYACRNKDIDCISVNPEIFDSYHPAGGDVSEVRAGDDGNVVSQNGLAAQAMGYSDNILNSARCAGLFGKTCRKI